jgi:homoserine dehydrogenase
VAARLIDGWQLLTDRAGATPALRRVAVRDLARPRALALPRVTLDANPEGLIDDPAVAIVVEVMGGVDRASSLIERALRLGKPVVTANKAAMAVHGLELAALAADSGVSLRYEAAVGGGLPVVALLRDSLRADRVDTLQMIINGTTNIILTAMERSGLSLEQALADAQRRGFAEADPSADVDGHDAAAKLLLLSRLAFDSPLLIDDVATTGIGAIQRTDIACAVGLGGRVKLVAQAIRSGASVAMSVRPTVVLAGHPLHGVDDADNALLIHADLAGTVMVSGLGGGGESTASAVVSDLVATVRAPGDPPRVPTGSLQPSDGATLESAAYLRVALADLPEAASLVLQALGDRGVGVVESIQPAQRAASVRELVVITAPLARETLEGAVQTLDSLTTVDRVAALMDCLGAA